MKKSTSWGPVAEWYSEHLENGGETYQEKVILPNLVRLLEVKPGEKILDLACGQGFFSREIAKLGADVTGADIAPELIIEAKKLSPKEINFYATPAHKLNFAKAGEFDTAICVLALQNIENIGEVLAEVKRVLKPEGKLLIILNHPAFRIPGRSSWQFDEEKKIQYRRLDGYLSGEKIPITMHPGKAPDQQTLTYHRSLQDWFKVLNKNNFAITRLEEWISHKQSGKGPRQKAEDLARKEFPLFLLLEAHQG